MLSKWKRGGGWWGNTTILQKRIVLDFSSSNPYLTDKSANRNRNKNNALNMSTNISSQTVGIMNTNMYIC